jgi:integrase/recombinase XerD
MKVLEETGLRISECLKIRINDLNLKEGTIFIPETKNRKNRVVYFTPGLSKEIKLYMELRQQFLFTKKLAATSLFCNNNGGELNISTIQDAITLYGKIAGLDYIRVSPHTFRHTFAKNFLLNGGDIFTLKDILGHSSLDMVYRYARLWDQERHQKYTTVMEKYTRSKKRIAK